jgi:hypothetical protein
MNGKNEVKCRPAILEEIVPNTAAVTTFYMSITGSDSNSGISSDSPWRTLAHAFRVMTQR